MTHQKSWKNSCYDAMNDDFNSSILIAELFEWVRIINTINDGKASIDETNFKLYYYRKEPS